VLVESIIKAIMEVARKAAAFENYKTMKYKHWQLMRMVYMHPI